jgi:hypothetical protein
MRLLFCVLCAETGCVRRAAAVEAVGDADGEGEA